MSLHLPWVQFDVGHVRLLAVAIDQARVRSCCISTARLPLSVADAAAAAAATAQTRCYRNHDAQHCDSPQHLQL